MGNAKSKESSARKVDTTLEFTEFVKDSMNYEIFCSYLSYRQSIENILFLQKVTAIYQIVYKYKTLYDASCEKGETEGEPRDDQRSLSITDILQLKHLRDIYNEYEQQIGALTLLMDGDRDNHGLKRYDIDFFKFAFDAIYEQIYHEFIDEDASNQINISYDTRMALNITLHNNKLLSFDDYLHFFDDANYEIYQLLTSNYDHGFADYISAYLQLSENDLNI